jgi:hypothetical protein
VHYWDERWECDTCGFGVAPEDYCILDGHNRYEICTKHALPFDTTVIDIPTRDDATIWIIQNQLGRRNLSDVDKVLLARQLRPMLEAQAKIRQHGGQGGILLQANLPEAKGQVRDHIAQIAGVSARTVDAVETILDHGAPEIIQAARTKALSISAALPLTDLPTEHQASALQEAHALANGKKPTAPQTRAIVSRTQVVATVKDHLAQGKTPPEAVSAALKAHDITLPTPALADAICQATDRQVTLAATDGYWHDGRTKEEEAARAAQTGRMFQLFNALEGLATLPPLAVLVAEIPAVSAYRVDQYLDQAVTNLCTFDALWKETRDDVATGSR